MLIYMSKESENGCWKDSRKEGKTVLEIWKEGELKMIRKESQEECPGYETGLETKCAG